MSAFLLAVFAGLRDTGETARPRLLVDADGLNALAKERDWPALLPPESIVTPHPGEMSRLLGGEEVSGGGADRLAVAERAASAWGHVVALKGGCTVIAAPDGHVRINWPPNPALATAGTGDVLAGVIGALLAQGLAPLDAASLGVYLHGRAGLRVAARLGVAGAVAGDLPEEAPLAIREIARAVVGELEQRGELAQAGDGVVWPGSGVSGWLSRRIQMARMRARLAAEDVAGGVVTDHHGLVGGDAERVERAGEDGGVRLAVASLDRDLDDREVRLRGQSQPVCRAGCRARR